MIRKWIPAFVAVLALGTSVTQAKEKPFKVSGAGIVYGIPFPNDPPREHWSIGTATHMGKYYGVGAVDTLTIESIDEDGNIYGTFESSESFIFEAKKGDKLVTSYGRTDLGAAEVGTVKLVNMGDGIYFAQWVAEFVVDGTKSTGRFAGVSGSWIMYAESDAFVLEEGSTDPVKYAWHGKGKLNFPK
jgi:hypothetical protein